MENVKISNIRKYLIIILLACVGASIYKVSYLKEVFYDELLVSLQISNTQMGYLSSVVGITASISYFIGGFVADRFKPKLLVVLSSIGAGIVTLWYATLPSFKSLLIIHFLLAIFGMMTFWSAYIKIVHILGGENNQGKYLGFSEGVRSLVGIILPFGALWIVNIIANTSKSIQFALVYYAIIYFVLAIAAFFIITDVQDEKKKEHISKEDYIQLFKSPGLWLVCLLVFGTYSIFALQSYTTPYLSGVWEVSTSTVGTIAIIRQYGIGLLSMPLFGIFADKFKSSNKVAFIGLMLVFFSAFGLRILPVGSSTLLVIVLICALAFFDQGVRGIYYATMNEARIPDKLAGTAIGIISAIGFLPDAFIFTQVGRWLDKYDAVVAYKMIFNYMMIMVALGIVATIIIKIRSKKGGN